MASVKICGIRDLETAQFAAECGADWIGFVFASSSPRAITVERASAIIAELQGVVPVGLIVDADDVLVDAVVCAGNPVLQLHGRESPERVAEIQAMTNAQVWRAVGVSERPDLDAASDFARADRLLIDAKPPRSATRTGGHGTAFDWSILDGWQPPRPWLLAGGLTPDNVSEAIARTGATAVDVSSGVESAPGVKDRAKIRDFIQAAKGI